MMGAELVSHSEPRPQDQQVAKRPLLRWWLMGGPVVVLIAIAFFLMQLQGSARVPPLAVAQLEDGTQLELRAVTQQEPHTFEVRATIPANPRLGRLFPGWTARNGGGGLSTVIWLSLTEPGSGKVLDTSRIHHCVLVDEQGWHWLAQDMYRNYYQGGRFEGRSGGSSEHATWIDGAFSNSSPNSPLPAGDYFDIVQSFNFPRQSAQRATLRAYDANSKLLAEMPLEIPAGPSPPAAPAIHELPHTKEFQGLAVTLESLEYQKRADIVSGVADYQVKPKVSLQWEGGEARGWRTTPSRIHLTDAQGNQHSTLKALSPYSKFWNVELEFSRDFQSPFTSQQTWESSPFPLPAMGEAIDLNEEHEIDGVKIKLLKVLGAGHHELIWKIPGVAPPRRGYARGSVGRQEGFGQVKGTLTPGQETWTADLKMPVVFFSHEGEGEYRVHLGDREHYYYEDVKVPSGTIHELNGPARRAVGYLDKAPPESTQARVTFRVTRPMRFQFTVQPPRVDAVP